MFFSLGHISACGYPYLVMHPTIDIHTWSCVHILIFPCFHVLPCWYSHLVMYLNVDSHTYSYILYLYPHLFTFATVDIHTWWGVPVLLFSFGHVSLCIFKLGHVSPWWYSRHNHLFPCYYSNLTMYCCVAILTWSCGPMWIFTFGLVYLCWYYTYSCSSMLITTHAHVFLCCYSNFLMCPCVDIYTLSWILSW